jgi:hypothetical protein
MDALNFEYPDYERLDEGDEGAKKKRVVSILKRQAMWSIEKDQRSAKKQKISAKPKDSAPKNESPQSWPLPRWYKMYQRRLSAPLRPPLLVLQKY